MLRSSLFSLFTVVALVAAGCGSEGGDDSAGTTTASETTSTVGSDETQTTAETEAESDEEPEVTADNTAEDITGRDMCELLTEEQLGSVIEGVFTTESEEADLEENGNSPSCTWSSDGSVDLTESGITGLVLVGLSQQNFDLNRGFWSELEEVDGIGDEAYLVQEGSILYVRSGTNGFWVTMTGSSDVVSGEPARQPLTALANQVVANL